MIKVSQFYKPVSHNWMMRHFGIMQLHITSTKGLLIHQQYTNNSWLSMLMELVVCFSGLLLESKNSYKEYL